MHYYKLQEKSAYLKVRERLIAGVYYQELASSYA